MNYENIRNNIVKVFPCKSQTSWGRNTFQREVPTWTKLS